MEIEEFYMKKSSKSSINYFFVILAFITITIFVSAIKVNAASIPNYSYRAHVMNKGWLSSVTGGKTAGTTGEERRLEAFRISVFNGNTSGVSYRAYCADEGWQRWVTSNNIAGTTEKKRQIEAIQIKLTNGLENKYDVYYRTHCADYGWLGWAKNGEMAGGTGKNLRVEAFQLKIVPKDSSFSRQGNASYVTKFPDALCEAHVMNKGWLPKVSLGETVGTIDEERRLEAFYLFLKNGSQSGISYRAHCSDIGWQGWKTSGQMAGTAQEKRQIEGIQIKLSNGLEKKFDIYYRAHCANYGWLGWAKNGELSGTTGKNIRMEAFQVELVLKGEYFSRGGRASYVEDKSNNNSTSNNLKYWDSMVGKTAANIGSTFYTTRNISYRGGYKGQCTWYAYGRFYEVNGIALKTAPHAKYWISNNRKDSRVNIVSSIKPKSIAVRTTGRWGHVMFIENVTYSGSTPQYVYYTECNDDGNGKYNSGKDCIVKKLAYSTFRSRMNPAGYIVKR